MKTELFFIVIVMLSARNNVACHVERSRIFQLSELKPNLFELFKRAYEKSQIVNISTSNLVLFCRGGVCPPLYFKAVLNLISFVVYFICSLSLSTFWPQKVAKTPGTRVSQVTPVLCSCHIMWALGRTSFAACVCRSNLGNKRTRFTHSHHRMAHTLRHFCSYSSIGTDTRCCSNGAGFLFDITFCWWIASM